MEGIGRRAWSGTVPQVFDGSLLGRILQDFPGLNEVVPDIGVDFVEPWVIHTGADDE